MKITPISASFPDSRGTVVDDNGRIWILSLDSKGLHWSNYTDLPDELIDIEIVIDDEENI